MSIVFEEVQEGATTFHQFAPEDLSDPRQSVPLTQITRLALTLYDSEAPDPTAPTAIVNGLDGLELIVNGVIQTTAGVTDRAFTYAQDPADGRWKSALVFTAADMTIAGECRAHARYVAAYRIVASSLPRPLEYTHEKGFLVTNLARIP